MTTTDKDTERAIQLSKTPLMYADSLVGLAIGPFVSKLILGVENPDQQNVPTLQISMPTNALYNLAKHVLDILHDPEAQKSITQGHEEYQKTIAESR